jgi:hypothetical protein
MWEAGNQTGLLQQLKADILRGLRSGRQRADRQRHTPQHDRGNAADHTKLMELVGRGAYKKAMTQFASFGVPKKVGRQLA